MKEKNVIKILLYIYLFLYIFSMINREFKPFGFDLRFIVVPLGCLVIFLKFIKNDLKIIIDKEDKTGSYLILFYIVVFLSNISWIWNGIDMNTSKFINEIILLSNTFIGILVIYIYRKNIDFQKILRYTIISCLILSLSIFLVYKGVPFEKIMGDASEADIYYGNEQAQHKNILGDNFRCAGYASDPNYATILLFFGIICTIKLKKIKKWIKFIVVLIFSAAIGLSFSKTIIAGAFAVGMYTILYKKIGFISKNKKIINRLMVITLFIIVFIIPMFDLDKYFPQTLTIRFEMWKGAQRLFFKSPIVGSGITSFRSFFEITHINWYVHCHSTFWQVLSETGIVGLILYSKMLINALDNKNTATSYFLTILFIIWSMTYETIALPLSTFALYILELENVEKIDRREENK